MNEAIYKKVMRAMKGASNEEAEEIAFSILGQTYSKRIYVQGEKEGEAMYDCVKRIAEAIVDYKNEHSLELAIGKTFKSPSNVVPINKTLRNIEALKIVSKQTK